MLPHHVLFEFAEMESGGPTGGVCGKLVFAGTEIDVPDSLSIARLQPLARQHAVLRVPSVLDPLRPVIRAHHTLQQDTRLGSEHSLADNEPISSLSWKNSRRTLRRMRPIDPDRAQKNVGGRIAELREKLGLTQAELAEDSDVSLRYLQRVEAGGANLTIRSLVAFANVLGTRLTELFRVPQCRTKRPGRPRRRARK